MTTLFIPTRNRPESLTKVLTFMAGHSPGSKICIADGSSPDKAAANERNLGEFRDSLDISFFHFDEDYPLPRRIVDALERIDDEYVTVGADDDYIDMGVAHRSRDFLATHSDHVLCMGYRVDLDARYKRHVRATLFHAFSVDMDDILERQKHFTDWSFATSYCTVGKEHVLKRYDMLCGLDIPNCHQENGIPIIYGFMDYLIGLFDLSHGKIKVLPELACVSTKVPGEAYVRSQDPLSCLKQAHGILRLQETVEGWLAAHGLPRKSAARESSQLMRRRLGELLGARLTNLHGFASGRHFSDPDVVKQLREFKTMFCEESLRSGKGEILRTANANAVEILTGLGIAPNYTQGRTPAGESPPEAHGVFTEDDVELYKYLDPFTLVELDRLPENAPPR